MTPKLFYSSYQADDDLSDINFKIRDLVLEHNINNVFEFGCGTGKNLKMFHDLGKVTCGLDISPINVIHASVKHGLPFVIIGNESNLGHLCEFDVSFTISVLVHIELINKIIADLKRMTRKAIYLAETNDIMNEYYFPHDYESLGFTILNYGWVGKDGATYHIFKWTK
jgi:hypothetical protein